MYDHLPTGADGKPIPTDQQVEEFLEICDKPFGRMWAAMLYKAHIRAYKGAWVGRSTILGALRRLKDEIIELEEELAKPEIDHTAVLYEAADICNFAVVLEDLVYHNSPLGSEEEGQP